MLTFANLQQTQSSPVLVKVKTQLFNRNWLQHLSFPMELFTKHSLTVQQISSLWLFLVMMGNFTFSIQIPEPMNLLTFSCLLYIQGWLMAAQQQYSCSAAGHRKCEDNRQKQMKREWEGVYACMHSSLWEKWITSLPIKEWFPTGAILTTCRDFCQTM